MDERLFSYASTTSHLLLSYFSPIVHPKKERSKLFEQNDFN